MTVVKHYGRVSETPCFPGEHSQKISTDSELLRDRKGTPKNFCDKDFAELSGELSGAICQKTLVLMGNGR